MLVMLSFCAAAQEFDTAIVNGRVLDPESGLDAIRSLGIQGGRIAAISAGALHGRTVIDAKGLVVTAGFIDLHSHGQTPENYRFKARDGVTTALELEAGVWPVGALVCDAHGQVTDQLRRQQRAHSGEHGGLA